MMKDLIKHYFNIEVNNLKRLGGYDNANYLVISNDKKYIFKTYLASQKEIFQLIESENQVLQFLDGFNTSKPISGIDDNYLFRIDFKGEQIIIRLLSFVEGEFLSDVEQNDELLKSFGYYLADLDLKLANYKDPFIHDYQHVWDNQNWRLSQDLIPHIIDTEKREWVEYFFQQYEEQVVPKIPFLRKQIIHNDANEGNVLVKNGRVSGVIDFGDVSFTFLINELANAIAYIILEKKNPLDIACVIIGAYTEKLPLSESEIDVLYYLIAVRLSISVCNSAYGRIISPENMHIFTTEKGAFRLLEQWILINPIEVQRRFRYSARLGS